MSRKAILDSVQVPNPCNKDWGNMVGDGRKRFCFGCSKDVYNLSAMSQREGVRFAAKNEGKICIRYARLPNGRILTTDTTFYRISRRTSVVASGVIAASISLVAFSSAVGQSSLPQNQRNKANETRNKIESKLSQISFTVFDMIGAVVPDAQVTLTNKKTRESSLTLSNMHGIAQFYLLEHGHYDLEVSCCGFNKYKNVIRIKEKAEPNVEVSLDVGIGPTGSFIFDWSDIPLFRAIAQADNEIVKQKIKAGFNINSKDSYGNTALAVAVDHCNFEIVQFLLNHKANVNLKGRNNIAPILMLDGCDSDEKETATKIVRLLISYGADVNVRNEDNETLLMKACEDEAIEGVKLLLEAGANPNLKNENGETAYQMTDSVDIKQLLLKYGARPK